ncbi:MAG: hypothetical protein ACOY94_24115 [Bacillota bacterium]
MTYLIYTAWILALVLTVGELDNLISRRLMQRFRLTLPEGHWLTSGFLSAMLPGLGQFLNSQPLKAIFIISWPFLTMWGWPVPRPWQLLALKTGWILLPWWAAAVADAIVVGFLTQRSREREQQAPRQGQVSNTVDYFSYLSNRQKRRNSGN